MCEQINKPEKENERRLLTIYHNPCFILVKPKRELFVPLAYVMFAIKPIYSMARLENGKCNMQNTKCALCTYFKTIIDLYLHRMLPLLMIMAYIWQRQPHTHISPMYADCIKS